MRIRHGRSSIKVLLAIALALASVIGLPGILIWHRITPATKPGGLLVTISKDTTYITSPRLPDGYPDYVNALNETLGKDLAPNDNAAIPLLQAFGPSEIEPKHRKRYFELLGIPELRESGDYLLPWPKFLELQGLSSTAGAIVGASSQQKSEDELAEEAYESSTSRPWRREEFPWVASWLDKNAKQIDLIVEASKKPHYFSPIVTDDTLVSALPSVSIPRTAAQALRCRAFNHLGEGRYDQGLSDFAAGQRLAKVTAEAPFVVGLLIGTSVELALLEATRSVIEEQTLSREQVVAYRDQIIHRGPLPTVASAIDQTERLFALDCLSSAMRSGSGSAQSDFVFEDRGKWHLSPEFTALRHGRLDWEIPFRLTNDWYDELVAIGSLSYAARPQAIADFETKFDRWKEQCRAAPWISITKGISTGERIAARATSTMANALTHCYNAESRAETLRRAAILLCDLELFRRDHGNFPDDLGQLVPRYCSVLPSDAFADSPFIYRKEADGCKLYSRGRNQIDEQGRGYEDGDFDDIGFTVRIESSKPKQP